MAIDFYDIDAALLRQEPARFAALQSVIEQVNAKLARVDDSHFALLSSVEPSGKKRRIRFRRGVRGVTDQTAEQNSGLTQADALALFSLPRAQSGAAELVRIGRDFALPGLPAGRPADLPMAALPSWLRANKQRDGVAGPISGAEILRLVAQAGPEVDDHALPAASILPQDALPQMPGAAERGGSRGPLSRFVPAVRNGPGEGAQIRLMGPAHNGRKASAMMDDVWRRIKTPAKAESGNAAYGADGGARLVGAIVTATLAAQQAQFSGRAPEPAQGSRTPGATPDAPVYTRMVPDHPAVPVQVTNADTLINATVNTLAMHQSALPTGPTGLNNNLVPPAPGVPAPGSYQP
jgi:hypothetical protein